MPPSIVIPPIGERGQPTVGVGPTDKVVEVFPNMPSSILAKRKCDDGVGVSPLEFARSSFGSISCPGYCSAVATTIVVAASTPPPPPAMSIQEIYGSLAIEVSAPTTLASPVGVPPSTIVVPLLSVGVATTSALVMLPPPSSAPSIPP